MQNCVYIGSSETVDRAYIVDSENLINISCLKKHKTEINEHFYRSFYYAKIYLYEILL